MRNRRLPLTLLFIFGMFGMGHTTVLANRVQMALDIGYGGYVAPGHWNPLRVTVSGMSGPSTIEIHRLNHPGLVEYYPCPEASDGLVKLECPVYAEPTGEVFQVRLIADGQNVAEQKLNTSKKKFPGHIVLTVDVPAPVRQAVSRVLLPQEPVMVVAVDSDELPSIAIDYDGISGLIIADPNILFTPAQRRAVRPWVSGGGFLFLSEPVFKNNLYDVPLAKRENISGVSLYRYGLGRVGTIYGRFTESSWSLGTEEWKRVLQFKAYNESRRLAVGQCFANSAPPIQRPPKPTLLFWLFPVFWGLTAVIFRLTASRKAFSYLLLLTLSASVLAVPVGLGLGKQWHRGAEAVNRLVILPNGEGWFDTQIQLPRAGLWDLSGLKASPWSVSIEVADQALGSISAGNERSEWRHRSVFPRMALAPQDEENLRWIGFLSEVELTRGLGNQRLDSNHSVALWARGKWKIIRAQDGETLWKSTNNDPDWLRFHRRWWRSLIRVSPNTPWMFGMEDCSMGELKVQGSEYHRVIWAKPLVEEETP